MLSNLLNNYSLLYIHWNPNPEIFNIGGLSIRWYGLLFALGFLFGYLIMQRIFSKEGIDQKVLDRLSIYMLLGTIIGARLGHCFFYEPMYYLSNPLEILNIRQGGLASHGAAIGIIIALWLFSRKEKRPISWILDRIVIVVALAGSLIRIGNLMNSEIYGAPTNVSWAFIFDQVDQVPRHPSQIYESVVYFLLFIILWWLYKRKNATNKPFLLFGIFLLVCFGYRFFIEFIKDVQVPFEQQLPLNMGQWLSIPFIVIGIFLIIKSPKKA
ncbi:MAG: prolipoprotein diacylglyceryl transferase [Bacteroidales bacterium]|nr:prolipoprotein diacylglyceryl transferase [Bacteroidales bacterium]